MDVRHSITRHGGLAAARELKSDGVGRGQLAAAVRDREVFRVRQGWYALPGLDTDLTAAARVGGVATCVTALAQIGVWVPPDGRLHVAVPRNACELRSPDDHRRRLGPDDDRVRIHWDAPTGRSRLRVEPLDALIDLTRCAGPDLVLAASDSLVRARPDLVDRWRRRLHLLPSTVARESDLIDGVCESGTETLFHVRIRRRCSLVRRQVRISGVGRVDFLIGERLVVEIDGSIHHHGPEAFEHDRRRDAALAVAGYRVLRFSYRQVMYDWPAVEAAVLAAVQRGDHR